MKENEKFISVLKIVYFVGLIGLGLYAVGYIFGEWLATGQIDLSNLNILLPMVLGLPALLLFKKESDKNWFSVCEGDCYHFLEELFCRGIVMGKVFGKDSIVGLLRWSFLFGLIHVPTNFGSWIIYSGMGLVLGLAYQISVKYTNALILHSLNNFIGFLFMLLMQSFSSWWGMG